MTTEQMDYVDDTAKGIRLRPEAHIVPSGPVTSLIRGNGQGPTLGRLRAFLNSLPDLPHDTVIELIAEEDSEEWEISLTYEVPVPMNPKPTQGLYRGGVNL